MFWCYFAIKSSSHYNPVGALRASNAHIHTLSLSLSHTHTQEVQTFDDSVGKMSAWFSHLTCCHFSRSQSPNYAIESVFFEVFQHSISCSFFVFFFLVFCSEVSKQTFWCMPIETPVSQCAFVNKHHYFTMGPSNHQTFKIQCFPHVLTGSIRRGFLQGWAPKSYKWS